MKKILLLGSGELGKEFVIAAKRAGQYVVACDRYENAPAMQVADEHEVFNMLDGDARVEEGPISWVADNQRKGISPGAVSVTIHASRRFSEEHVDEDPQDIAHILEVAARPLLKSNIIEFFDGH